MNNKVKVYLISLGCARNLVDSEVMLSKFTDAGYSIIDNPSKADVIVVNSCSFITTASEESIDVIIELSTYKNLGNCKCLVVTGCLPQRFGKDIAVELPEVDVFLGTLAHDKIIDAIEESLPEFRCVISNPNNYVLQKSFLPRIQTTPYISYVKIAEGCNRHCSYCIIPKLRGELRSYSYQNIINEAKSFIDSGTKEIILIAESTTDYGQDFYSKVKEKKIKRGQIGDSQARDNQTIDNQTEDNQTEDSQTEDSQTEDSQTEDSQIGLETVIKGVANISNNVWVRLLYGSPDTLTDKTIDIIGETSNVSTYFDLPIQHASSKILKLMGRNYSKEDLIYLFNKIRVKLPNAILRTTIIVGFPGETDKEFNILISFIKEIGFDYLGVFKYSDSDDIPSHKLSGQVSDDVAQKRYDILMTKQLEISSFINKKHLNRKYLVLIEENPEEGLFIGRTMFQAPEVDGVTFVYADNLRLGDFVNVKIVDTYEYDIVGEIIK